MVIDRTKYMDIDENLWMQVIRQNLPEKLHDMNEKAFALGREGKI